MGSPFKIMSTSETQHQVYLNTFKRLYYGDFQTWVEGLLTALHPAGDFQAIRQAIGDGGMDGFVISSQLVYQVYAPASGAEKTDSNTAKKIRTDFDKAYEHLGGRLKGWTFIHNHPTGEIGKISLKAINDLKEKYPNVSVSVLGINSLWEYLSSESTKAEELLKVEAFRNTVRQVDLDLNLWRIGRDVPNIALLDVFVEQFVRKGFPRTRPAGESGGRRREGGEVAEPIAKRQDNLAEAPPILATAVLKDPSNRCIILFGGPGSGKSTLCKHHMLNTGDRLPVWIDLAKYDSSPRAANGGYSFLRYLADDKHANLGLTEELLTAQANKAVVVFDGLDEILDEGRREETAKGIVGFAQLYQGARILVTSRLGCNPNCFHPSSDSAGSIKFIELTLQDLNEDLIGVFLDRWYGQTDPARAVSGKSRILRAVQSVPEIRELAGNPMLLTIMAMIGSQQELPSEHWKLYKYAASVLIEQLDSGKKISVPRFDWKQMETLLGTVALRMQLGDGHRGDIDHEDLLLAAKDVLGDENAGKLMDRLQLRSSVLCHRGDRRYGFVHRAFLEYFCAVAILDKKLPATKLVATYYEKYWHDTSWHEILTMICGMTIQKADYKCASNVIDFLSSKKPRGKSKEPWDLILGLRCIGELQPPKQPSAQRMIANSADRLLRSLCNEFDERLHSFFIVAEEQVLPALVAAKANWSWDGFAEEQAKVWLNTISDYNAQRDLGRFLACLGAGSERARVSFEKHLERTDGPGRVSALVALARGWPDTETRSLLFKHMQNSDFWFSSAAVHELGRGYQDDEVFNLLIARYELWLLANYFRKRPRTIEFILERARDDNSDRGYALVTLAEQFPSDERTQEVLVEKTGRNVSPEIRKVALTQLAQWFPNAQTFEILKDEVTSGSDEEIQRTAIDSLASSYSTRDEAWLLLASLANSDSNDSNKVLRINALVAMGRHMRGDPRTLRFLIHRAKIDPNDWIRRDTLCDLQLFFVDDPALICVLKDRATNDPAPSVRKIALDKLSDCGDMGLTKRVLHDRVFNDVDLDVRKYAYECLERLALYRGGFVDYLRFLGWTRYGAGRTLRRELGQ